jgi:hypothetical protein
MSHHFDTPTAQGDPRISLCDFYLFRGRFGTTVMALTVNPDARISAADTFHEEELYAFRFDLNNGCVGAESCISELPFAIADAIPTGIGLFQASPTLRMCSNLTWEVSASQTKRRSHSCEGLSVYWPLLEFQHRSRDDHVGSC